MLFRDRSGLSQDTWGNSCCEITYCTLCGSCGGLKGLAKLECPWGVPKGTRVNPIEASSFLCFYVSLCLKKVDIYALKMLSLPEFTKSDG